MRARAVDHPCEAYAVRVEHDGRSLVYSGDTGPCRRARRGRTRRRRAAVRGDLAARHRVVGRAAAGIHLSGRQAGEHAAAAGVGRLLITHVPAWFDAQELLAEAKEAFGGPVELVAPDAAYDGLSSPHSLSR